jgi:hypothetical protein
MLCNQINKTFHVIRSVRLIYFLYFHFVPSYGIIFWDNSVHKYIFKIKKKIFRVITNSGMCFKNCRFCLYSQYIYSLLMLIVKNRDLFELNSDIHKISTRYNNDLHLPSAQLKLFQKGFFLIQVLKCTTTFHWLLRNCHMMLNDLVGFWKDLFNQIPFIPWNSILTVVGNDTLFVVNHNLILVKGMLI